MNSDIEKIITRYGKSIITGVGGILSTVYLFTIMYSNVTLYSLSIIPFLVYFVFIIWFARKVEREDKPTTYKGKALHCVRLLIISAIILFLVLVSSSVIDRLSPVKGIGFVSIIALGLVYPFLLAYILIAILYYTVKSFGNK